MELIKISDEYTALFGCEKCRTKKTADLDKSALKKTLTIPVGFGDVMKIFVWWFEKVYTHTNTWIAGRKNEETSLPPKDAFYSRLNMKGISDQDHEHSQQVWNRITPEHESITLEDH